MYRAHISDTKYSKCCQPQMFKTWDLKIREVTSKLSRYSAFFAVERNRDATLNLMF